SRRTPLPLANDSYYQGSFGTYTLKQFAHAGRTQKGSNFPATALIPEGCFPASDITKKKY
ncbi:hypothetical protein, partial [Bacteroides sp. HPS0048]|uniref:hypothetical protein n=1 Tax=Bacteroides sp. HPS0048 TaxID=1078089 RepID=UPI001E2D5B26